MENEIKLNKLISDGKFEEAIDKFINKEINLTDNDIFALSVGISHNLELVKKLLKSELTRDPKFNVIKVHCRVCDLELLDILIEAGNLGIIRTTMFYNRYELVEQMTKEYIKKLLDLNEDKITDFLLTEYGCGTLLSEKEVKKYKNHPNANVRAAVALNGLCLDELIKDEDETVRKFAEEIKRSEEARMNKENKYTKEIEERKAKKEKYRTKGLEMLMYDGVHPDKVGQQHESWKKTWVSISDVVGSEDYDYHGLGYIYFVNHVEGTFHCVNPEDAQPKSMSIKFDNEDYDSVTDEEDMKYCENLDELIKEAGYDKDTCVPVTVSCHSCMVVGELVDSW